jgi:hypothetical protein
MLQGDFSLRLHIPEVNKESRAAECEIVIVIKGRSRLSAILAFGV